MWKGCFFMFWGLVLWNMAAHGDTAYGVADCTPCKNLAACIVNQCANRGGYAACQNAAVSKAVQQDCIKQLNQSALNKNLFNSYEGMRAWAAYLMWRISIVDEYYVNGKSFDQICSTIEACPETAGEDFSCASITSWTSPANNREVSSGSYRVGNMCLVAVRCVAGAYGLAYLNDDDACVQCPALDRVAGQSAAGSVAVSECYIPAGNTFTDDAGTYTLVGDCYYTE